MVGLIEEVSDDLRLLSEDLVRIIEMEDKEYGFKMNGGYVEKNVLASKFQSR